MTTRPGFTVTDSLRKTRTKHYAHAVKITRTDGFVMRFTDHDRSITFEGELYVPLMLAELTAERREAALRSGDQEARGFVDGSIITVPDLLGNKYRGAEVQDVTFDWRRPYLVFARHRKWIRTESWTGSKWVGVMEARSQVLQRQVGGAFGGTFTVACPFKLGEPNTCRKAIEFNPASGLPLAYAGARVQTIVDNTRDFRLLTSTLSTGLVDGFFRDGEMEWVWGPSTTSGTVTATTTSTTIEDSTKTWTPNEHVGKQARLLQSGANSAVIATANTIAAATVISNTATVLTFATQSNMAGLLTGTAYDVCPFGSNRGVISPIVYYTHADRHVELLLPVPLPIVVNDSGIMRVGCDGLFSTCKDKFANQINFGGDPFAPSANAIIEPPEAQ